MIFPKNKFCLIFGPYLAILLPKLCQEYEKFKEPLNFLIYNMEMQVRNAFQLKMTMIGEDIAKKVMFAKM